MLRIIMLVVALLSVFGGGATLGIAVLIKRSSMDGLTIAQAVQRQQRIRKIKFVAWALIMLGDLLGLGVLFSFLAK